MRRAPRLIYAASFFYCFALSTTLILIPLYVFSLGYSPVLIGLIVSVQGIFQLLLRLFGGILSDQIGEKRVLAFSFAALLCGALIFVSTEVVWALLAAQLIMGASRSVYWAASQSYASRISPADAGTALGRLASVVSTGNILGYLSGGVVSSLYGFQIGFLLCAALAAAALAANRFMPLLDRKLGSRSFRSILRPVPLILRNRIFYLAGIAAFAAAVPMALIASFYPVYFKQVGHGGATVGFLVAAIPVGAIMMGLAVGRVIDWFGSKRVFAVGLLAMGLLIMASPFVQSAWMLALLAIALGTSQQLLNVLYQKIAADNSDVNYRGIALSVPGHFWALCHLTLPSMFGLMVSSVGMRGAFLMSGGFLLVLGASAGVIYRCLAPPAPAEEQAAV